MVDLDRRPDNADDMDDFRATLHVLPVGGITRELTSAAAEKLAQTEARQVEYASELVLTIGGRTATSFEHFGLEFVKLLAEVGPRPAYNAGWEQINPWSKDEVGYHSPLGAGSYFGQYVIALTPIGISLSIDVNRRDFSPSELVERLNHAVASVGNKVNLTLTSPDWRDERNVDAPLQASIKMPYDLKSLQILKVLFGPELHRVPGPDYAPNRSVIRRCRDLMTDIVRTDPSGTGQSKAIDTIIELPISATGSGITAKLP